MAGVEAMEFVLEQMQVLDEQVRLARAVAEQRLHLGQRLGLDLPASRHVPAAAPSGTGMNAALSFVPVRHVSPSAP